MGRACARHALPAQPCRGTQKHKHRFPQLCYGTSYGRMSYGRMAPLGPGATTRHFWGLLGTESCPTVMAGFCSFQGSVHLGARNFVSGEGGGGAPLAKIAVFPATLHGSFSTHIQVGARTGEEPGLCASQTLPFHDCQPCLGQCPGLLLGRECNGQLLTEAGARAHLPPRGGLLH